MTRQLFGTDCIHSTANLDPMTAEVALRLGMAAGRQFVRGDHRHRAVIGKDTRLSGYLLEPALTAGLIATGMDVTLLGPLPTPAVAMLTRSLRADVGVMISASHNPFQDNGIKLFGPDGFKLSDETESEVEGRMRDFDPESPAAPEKLGRAQRLQGARDRYIEALKASLPRGLTLSGLRIVVDCAHGAAYSTTPRLFWALGADVIEIGTESDGTNINAKGGSTAPEAVCRAVVEHGADAGIALHSDADRALLADERGTLIDGDQLLALLAVRWRDRAQLRGNGIVATTMSNLGLERFLSGHGLVLHRTEVGDRDVVEYMRRSGHNLGGEQSGHIVMTDFSTTGDGTLAALQVFSLLCADERSLSEVARQFSPLPQRLRDCRLNGGHPLQEAEVASRIQAANERLDGHGRLLVRPSGTEPLIRVMVEADKETLLADVLDEVGGTIERYA